DRAIWSGLDRVVPVDRITDFDLSNNALRVHDGDQASRGLDRADYVERRSPRYMGVAATSAIITWRIAGATEHATPPCGVGCLVMRRYTGSSRSGRWILSRFLKRHGVCPFYFVIIAGNSTRSTVERDIGPTYRLKPRALSAWKAGNLRDRSWPELAGTRTPSDPRASRRCSVERSVLLKLFTFTEWNQCAPRSSLY